MRPNKAILLMNLSGSLMGGAQQREIKLFRYYQEHRNDYVLITNSSLSENAYQNNLFREEDNVEVINLPWQFYDPVDVYREYRSHKGVVKRSNIEGMSGGLKLFLKYLYYWLKFAFRLRKILKRNNIIAIYSSGTGGIWASPLQDILGFKLVFSYSDSSLSTVSSGYLSFFGSEFWPLKKSKKVDFLSENSLLSLRKKRIFLPKSKISISAGSIVDSTEFQPVIPKMNHIIFLSRLTHEKNPFLFIEAVKLLDAEHYITDYDYMIIGEGPLSDEVDEAVHESGVIKLKYMGVVGHSQDYLSESKIFVSLNQFNNYPSQALLEAMACENAVIASDVGDTSLLVSADEGFLVRLDPQEVANALYTLISNPDFAEQLGKNARAKVASIHNGDNYSRYINTLMTRTLGM